MFWITGATGLVGSHLLLELVKDGHQVVAFYHQQQPIELKRFFQFKGALELWNQIHWRKAADMDWEQKPSQCDGLFHCAAMVSYHHKDHKKMNEVNVLGTAQWVNWALDFDIPICHVSSIASLGKAESSGWVDEQCYWQPSKDHTEYSRTKFLSEMEIWRGIEEGLSAVMVNPGVIIGACEPHQSSGKLIQTVARGWNFYPSGGTGFVAATDVAKAMLQLMKEKKWGERYVLVGENWTMKAFFQATAATLGVSVPQKPVSNSMLWWLQKLDAVKEFLTGKRAVITRETILNTSKVTTYRAGKIQSELNFEFSSISSAISEAVEFMRPSLPLRP
jgi:nucleoside-diphosphate-sugar epimerase